MEEQPVFDPAAASVNGSPPGSQGGESRGRIPEGGIPWGGTAGEDPRRQMPGKESPGRNPGEGIPREAPHGEESCAGECCGGLTEELIPLNRAAVKRCPAHQRNSNTEAPPGSPPAPTRRQFLSPPIGGAQRTRPPVPAPCRGGGLPAAPARPLGLRPCSPPRPPWHDGAGGTGWGCGGGDTGVGTQRGGHEAKAPLTAGAGPGWGVSGSGTGASCPHRSPDTPGRGTEGLGGWWGICLQRKENRDMGLVPTGKRTRSCGRSYCKRKTPPHPTQMVKIKDQEVGPDLQEVRINNISLKAA